MILVFGATGNVGRQLVRQLSEAGHEVRAITRKPDDASMLESDLVEVRFGDLDRPETLPAVLTGVDSVFLINGGYPTDAVSEALAAASVTRVVFMSALAALTRPEAALSQAHLRTESALQGGDFGLTVLQPGQFASNTLQWREMIKQGTIYAPFADIAFPTIDPYDIAAVAALTLTAGDDSHNQGSYPLTGPASSPRQRARVLADELAQPIDFVELSAEQAREQLLRTAPPAMVDSLLEIFGEPSSAEREELTTVRDLLGRPPRDFASWVRQNRAAFG